ncbi:hypothetical protein D1007_55986 [Hordeum vulgare]|uniref:Uncharacterized protein n=1 Tax=Hordeum vulgare subsp. vulgare TaxID=112509 RepID=A0A8I7B4L9_HORVV|nr:uncharacterized protein LOC123439253 [Hordeum vulgare subsp. vulgare]KAE8772067.1 hypothetical protein D1007_55986 [Hordeum vulgare]KAI5004367.1 hypothetical protein ZWY2020_031610 [Hordeum vulgare]
MAAGTLQIRPRAKGLWLLVRRLLCRGNKLHRPTAGAGDQQGDGCGEKRSLLGRSGSLEELLGPDVAGAVRRSSARKDVQVQRVLLPERQRQHHEDVAEGRPAEATPDAPQAASAAAVQQYRRFMFGGFRRRLMMRRQWRPMLVAIPE